MADGIVTLPEQRPMNVGPSFEQIKDMATYFARSGMFGVKTPEQAFSLLMIAQSEGLHPARAMQEYHVINNRPTLKAEAMLGRYHKAGGKVKWIKHEDDEVVAEFTHESSGTMEVSWNMERAKQAGILGNATWKKYPRQMLRARVISEGVRLSYPGCIVGFYAVEEAMDFDDRRSEPVHVEATEAEFEESPKLPTGSVSPLDADGRSNREIKAAYNRLDAAMDQCSCVESLREWGKAWADDIADQPEDNRESLRGKYQRLMDQFKAVEA